MDRREFARELPLDIKNDFLHQLNQPARIVSESNLAELVGSFARAPTLEMAPDFTPPEPG